MFGVDIYASNVCGFQLYIDLAAIFQFFEQRLFRSNLLNRN